MHRSKVAPLAWIACGMLAATVYHHRAGLPDFEPTAQAQPAVATTNRSEAKFVNRPAPPPADLTPEEQANIRVYETANHSVVNIDTQIEQIDPMFMQRMTGMGSGSGSVLDKQGHILTNAHVIEDARVVDVTLATGETYPAEVVGQDREHDIAVLKIDAPSDVLFPLSLGSSDGLRVGQHVYALGNPFGLEGTLTKGIISSLNRSIEGRTGREMKSLIQTDAAMNPGNSGGPLLDSGARMIGMNVAIATRTGQNTGVGFAIPANRIRQIVPELIEHGRIIRPDHGIVKIREYPGRGIKVELIRPDGPADRAGLRAIVQLGVRRQGNVIYQTRSSDPARGDWLVAVDGQAVKSASDFLALMDAYKPGQTVTLTIIRDGQQQEVEMTLGEA